MEKNPAAFLHQRESRKVALAPAKPCVYVCGGVDTAQRSTHGLGNLSIQKRALLQGELRASLSNPLAEPPNEFWAVLPNNVQRLSLDGDSAPRTYLQHFKSNLT